MILQFFQVSFPSSNEARTMLVRLKPLCPATLPKLLAPRPVFARHFAASTGIELVKQLRSRTSAGVVDCKQALTEADGDLDKAVELLKVKLGARAANLKNRAASEGFIVTAKTPQSNEAVLMEINCETDFASRGDSFKAFATGNSRAVELRLEPCFFFPLQNTEFCRVTGMMSVCLVWSAPCFSCYFPFFCFWILYFRLTDQIPHPTLPNNSTQPITRNWLTQLNQLTDS